MSLSLYVDGPRWRTHLRAVADATPGLVPVVKGNGYGLGIGRLARRAEWLGSNLLAVGTYAEVGAVEKRFSGEIMVLSPWRPFHTELTYGPRILHTVGRLEDLAALASQRDRPRVVLEVRTSMGRHGLQPAELSAALSRLSGVRLEGIAMHLPLAAARERVAEVDSWVGRVRAAGLVTKCVFVSHLSLPELASLSRRRPDLRFRPRVGTGLWLGERSALAARATVLDAHRVSRGDRVGYRQRWLPRDGTVLVVAGGTTHGIGLEAPTSGSSPRQRAVALARGGLDAAGFALSPFTVAGRQRWFVEPPHMQVSLVFVPSGVRTPAPGNAVDVDVRFTTTTFDRVLIS